MWACLQNVILLNFHVSKYLNEDFLAVGSECSLQFHLEIRVYPQVINRNLFPLVKIMLVHEQLL